MRFSIRDLLLIVTLAATGLGWFCDHRSMQKRSDRNEIAARIAASDLQALTGKRFSLNIGGRMWPDE